MKPTPISAGASSMASSARGSTGRLMPSVEGTRNASESRSLIAAPTAIPRKIQALPRAPAAVARSTSAQAVPSG